MQKMLSTANKLPTNTILSKFTSSDESIKTNILESKRNLKKYIKDTV